MDAFLIVDPPAPGPWNMAVDETLREWVLQTGRPVVRFYQWSPATLSLGYFQAYAARASHPGSAALEVVRRASGGGAIVHDQELTYSFVAADRDRFVREDPRWVELFHTALVETLRDWGLAGPAARGLGRIASRGTAVLVFPATVPARRAAG